MRSFLMDLSRFQFGWHIQIRVFSHMQKSVVRHFSRFNWISAGYEISLPSTIDAFLFSKALFALFQVNFSFGLHFSWDISRNIRVALGNKLYRKKAEMLTKINSNQLHWNSHKSSRNVSILTNYPTLKSGKITLFSRVNLNIRAINGKIDLNCLHCLRASRSRYPIITIPLKTLKHKTRTIQL